jgi:Zn-dependent protease with chaperone function
MDFFARQHQVRRMSVRLVILFIVAVIGIVVTVDLVAITVFRGWSDPATMIPIAVVVSLLTGVAIGLASVYRTVTLRGGGARVAVELGGQLVPSDTTDPELRRLRNVVEEIAIASGVSVPAIYVLRNEQGINAFAAGWSPADAAIAVTEGALRRLNRDELQGVIAHEFSHVVNGDMRLNIRLIGLLFGILFLTVIGRILLYIRGGKNNPMPFIGIALIAAGFAGVFAGRLIQASVSRQREYLADASAVQFTRQTSGIAGALKKIAGLTGGSTLASPRTEEVGHLLFGSGRPLSSLFATHPPLLDRIKVLEPSFDVSQLRRLMDQWSDQPPNGLAEDVALGLAEAPTPHLAHPAAGSRGATTPVRPEAVVAQIAAPTPASFARAAELLDEIPAAILDRARRADTAIPLLLGLLLADDPTARLDQHSLLAARYGAPVAEAANADSEELGALERHLRLPLAQIAVATVRQRSTADQETTVRAVFELIRADGQLTVFEYCLSRLLIAEVQDSLRPRSQWRGPQRHLTDNAPAPLTLLAVLAQAGATSADEASTAFRSGVETILPGRSVAYHPPAEGVVALEPGWDWLDALAPDQKSLMIQALVRVIGHDGQVTTAEAELLRTVCALLHCPLPPLPAPVPDRPEH